MRDVLADKARVEINPSWDFRYTLRRSICAEALDMFASQTRDFFLAF